jgi:hypothetical protein
MHAYLAFLFGFLSRRPCERCFAWRQILVWGSAGNYTRSTERPLGVMSAWSMVPA